MGPVIKKDKFCFFLRNSIHLNKNSLIRVAAFCFYVVMAWRHIDYYHADEHYQIIEFAGLKLGWNSPEDLAWEYNSIIRPTLQVWLCITLFKFLSIFSVEDPFLLSFSLRIISAVFAIYCINIFYNTTKRFLPEKLHFIYLFFNYFIWFIPFISVRYSSETWSGLFFLLGVSLSLKPFPNSKQNMTRIGLFSGLSFLFRFQTGIMFLGLSLWFLIIKKTNIRTFIYMFLPYLFVIQIGIILDSIFYQGYVVTFWNYFKINIIDGVSSNFGISPWTTIFEYLVYFPILPIGIILMLSFVYFIIYSPKNPVIWTIIPFIVVHALIPHKEVRFLFPLIWYSVFILFYGGIFIFQKRGRFFKSIKPFLFFSFLIVNLFALIFNLIVYIGNGEKKTVKIIDLHSEHKPLKLFCTKYGNPYRPLFPLTENFYNNPNVNVIYIKDVQEINHQAMTFSDTTYMLSIREVNLSELNHLSYFPFPYELKEISNSQDIIQRYFSKFYGPFRLHNYFFLFKINSYEIVKN